MRWQHTLFLPALAMGLMLDAQDVAPRSRPMPRSTDRLVAAGRTTTEAPRSLTSPGRAERAEVSTPVLSRRLPPTASIITPMARERCTVVPTRDYWRHHDLMMEIRAQARHGFIPATPFPADATELKDYTWVGSGWRIYGFLVPAGGSVRVALTHDKPAWFRLIWMDKWGAYRPGMKVRIGEPEALYENPEKETQAVYLLVDDPGFWSTESDPYTLKVARSFDPTKLDGSVTLAAGIWATPPPVNAAMR